MSLDYTSNRNFILSILRHPNTSFNKDYSSEASFTTKERYFFRLGEYMVTYSNNNTHGRIIFTSGQTDEILLFTHPKIVISRLMDSIHVDKDPEIQDLIEKFIVMEEMK